MLSLIRGVRGHPSHPPLTGAVIGAYTVAIVLQLAGAIGWREELMAQASFVVLVLALLITVPTVITGFADYVTIKRGTQLRHTANLHWIVMVFATTLFVIAAVLGYSAYAQRAGISIAALALSSIAYVVLAVGGWVGGSMVYVHGMRVEDDVEFATTHALKPRAETDHKDRRAANR